MILRNYNYGNFEGNPFVIGTTDKNEFFPIYTVFEDSRRYEYSDNVNFLSEVLYENVYLYRKPISKSSLGYSSYSKYADLFNALQVSGKPERFGFEVNGTAHFLTITRGYIADEFDNILLILTTKSFEVFDENNDTLKSENLRLYVSTDLVNNEIYKNIFKKIDTEYIDYCYKNNIDVIFTTSDKIHNHTFKNDFKVEFNNLTELQEHLNSGIGNNLFFDESIYHRPQEEVYKELPF